MKSLQKIAPPDRRAVPEVRGKASLAGQPVGIGKTGSERNAAGGALPGSPLAALAAGTGSVRQIAARQNRRSGKCPDMLAIRRA
jgi:hypothetical protein